MNGHYLMNGDKITLQDSREYGLPTNIKTGKLSNGVWVIIKDRKSRIIMKDGHLIKEQAEKIIDLCGAKKVCLGTTAPICSKTKLFLEGSNIVVHTLYKIQQGK